MCNLDKNLNILFPSVIPQAREFMKLAYLRKDSIMISTRCRYFWFCSLMKLYIYAQKCCLKHCWNHVQSQAQTCTSGFMDETLQLFHYRRNKNLNSQIILFLNVPHRSFKRPASNLLAGPMSCQLHATYGGKMQVHHPRLSQRCWMLEKTWKMPGLSAGIFWEPEEDMLNLEESLELVRLAVNLANLCWPDKMASHKVSCSFLEKITVCV